MVAGPARACGRAGGLNRGSPVTGSDAAAELAAGRRRVDDLGRVLPLAAVEPDGLAITSDGTYVRVIEADHVLQPWRGGIDHPPRLREGVEQLITPHSHRPAPHILLQAWPPHPPRAPAPDWAGH